MDIKQINEISKFMQKPTMSQPKSNEETHHHQLQKARQDWLREEIVWFEELKKQEYGRYITSEESYGNVGYNEAIQTIIDRYQSKLDQPDVIRE